MNKSLTKLFSAVLRRHWDLGPLDDSENPQAIRHPSVYR